MRIVLSTFPDHATAREVGRRLVEMQLAACANLLPGVESIYRWQGKVESSDEVLVIFKTTQEAYPAFAKNLAGLHPYDVPEIVALAPADVSPSYEAWCAASIAH